MVVRCEWTPYSPDAVGKDRAGAPVLYGTEVVRRGRGLIDMIRNGQIVCDSCGATITRTTAVLEADGVRMHNVCSACFATLKKQSIPPA